MEEISWRQISRALWLRAGDRNIKFFHRVAKLHMKFNHIPFVVVDGIHYDCLHDMKYAIHDFYNLFSSNLNLGDQKVLAHKSRGDMGDFLSENQNAFVRGCHILNAMLLANELIDFRTKSRNAGVVCKLDIEEA